MKKTDRRTNRTKRNIRNAFVKLIQKKELTAITVTELAELADIDRKTFYLHYNTIHDILAEIEHEVADKVFELLHNNKPFSIEVFMFGLNDIMQQDIDFYKHISRETSYIFLKGHCKDILKYVLKDVFFTDAKIPEEMFLIYAEYVSSGIIGIYTDWLRQESGISLEQLTQIAIDAVINGWNHIIVP